MPRPRTYNTEGVVLKHMRLGEADRIITLYTPDRGKVRAVVKGARRAKSRKGGFLQPLTHVHVSIAEGRSLDQVVEAETVASFRGVREDLGLVSTGLYLGRSRRRVLCRWSRQSLRVQAVGRGDGRARIHRRSPNSWLGTLRRDCWAWRGSARRCGSVWTCGEELAAGDHVLSPVRRRGAGRPGVP